MNRTNPWTTHRPCPQALAASRRGEGLAPKRAGDSGAGKKHRKCHPFAPRCRFPTCITFIAYCHKEYENICSNGVGLFADLAADINSHKAPDCTDRLYEPGKNMFLSKSGWVTILMYLTKTELERSAMKRICGSVGSGSN